MDLKEIKELIALMKRNDLSEFEMEQGDFKIALKRGVEAIVPTVVPQAFVAAPGVAPQLPAAAGAPAAEAPEGKEIVSPMVGTFYGSPTPDAQPYVKVGQDVDDNTVVCIIEAMKVMNEIKADARGTIAEMVAENGKPVQFGQALFRLR